jgi:hypothetical protein
LADNISPRILRYTQDAVLRDLPYDLESVSF